MLDKLYRVLSPYAKWKYILIGLGFTTFINLVAFPYAGKKLQALSPNASGPIDLKFSYSVTSLPV